ncbi:hypothetical protein BDF14DRAFT_1827104, partial [Spinellus fusiger]
MPKSKGKRMETSKPTLTTNRSNRACLESLPGSFKLPSDLIKIYNISHFISELEARSWKSEEKLAKKYFERTTRVKDTPEQVLAVLIRTMKSISKAPQVKRSLAAYCEAVASQLTTENNREIFKKNYNKEKDEMKIKNHEDKVSIEAKIASRILTTIETRSYKVKLRKRLDSLFEEGNGGNKEVMLNQKKDRCDDIIL